MTKNINNQVTQAEIDDLCAALQEAVNAANNLNVKYVEINKLLSDAEKQVRDRNNLKLSLLEKLDELNA